MWERYWNYLLSLSLQFQFPELFLLAIPLWLAYRRWGVARGGTAVLRLLLLALLLLVLTGPMLRFGGHGLDAVVVVDRSRSMPFDSAARIKELIVSLQKGRGTGNRVGIVTFGSRPEVEQELSNTKVLSEYTKEIPQDGSNLSDALHTALSLINQTRPARILVLSDGESNGAAPDSAARRARELRVPIDFRTFERQRTGDVAVDAVMLPESVSPREPFQFSVSIHADQEADATVTLFREEKPIATQERHLSLGSNPLIFRDVLEAGGLYNYTVRVEVPNDPLPENNRGAGVVRVEEGPRLLILNADGQDDNLVRALRSGRISIDVAAAKEHPLSQDSLDRYRGVILENIPASDLGRVKMERLSQFVEDLGGGLLLTGGERSFGTGGYFKSPLDEVLPVSMEIREEHRKTRLAMAIALDRSGSMAITVKGGKTKMHLADLGTAECVRLLSAGDSVAIIAVDSSPHVVQKLTPVDDPEPIARKALGIESMGGGIFVYDALVAAGEQLLNAEQSTKHIILFSDAADSEMPGDYTTLLAKYEAAGITTSVIGLGTKSDVDAKLLEDVAKRGKGNIMFTADPEELPRLFAQETMSIARSSFIKKDAETQAEGIPGKLLADARLMGDLSSGTMPRVDGYNLSYLKPRATLGAVSQDEYTAPWSAFWYRGLGRVAALTFEVDGKNSGQFAKWEDYSDYLITHARWLLGTGNPEQAFVTIERAGQDAVVTLELDPDRAEKELAASPELIVTQPGEEREAALQLPFEWQGPHTLQARFRLAKNGTYRPLVKLGAKSFVRSPVVTLPYSPEYAPRIGLPSGNEVLRSLAELTGGKPRVNPLEVLADPPRSSMTQSLVPWLFGLAIACLVLEIAGRRLSLWEKLVEAAYPAAEHALPQPAGVVPTPRRPTQKLAPATATATVPERASPQPEVPSVPQAAPVPSAKDIFEQAKRRAKRRL